MRHTLETTDAAIKRWETKLTRAMRQLSKLKLQRRRLEKAAAKPKVERPRGSAPMLGDLGPAIQESIQDQLKPQLQDEHQDIPEFLRRGMAAQAAVEKVIEDGTAALKAEIDETKRRKTKGRIEKMKAKQRGELKKMPLSGKAALEFINNG